MFQFHDDETGGVAISEVDNQDLTDEGFAALSERVIIMAFTDQEAMEIFRLLSSGKYALKED